MLYNKSAVKNRIPVTKTQIELARKAPLFELDKKILDYIRKDVVKGAETYYSMRKISDRINEIISYDYSHTFKGIRTASQVLKDKRGHCIEQGILFYAITKGLKIPTKPLIVKNPKGYHGSKLIENLGIHVFLLFEDNDDNDDNKYLADFLCIKKFRENGFCISQQRLSEREFVAFCLQDGGEDFAIHRNYKNAFLAFDAAKMIDPNNYTIYISAADAASNKGDLKKAEKWYKNAIKIAPNLTDTHWAYADFLFRAYVSPSYARRAYVIAAEKSTKDIQILNDLEKKLLLFGESELSETVKNKRLSIQNSKKLEGYF